MQLITTWILGLALLAGAVWPAGAEAPAAEASVPAAEAQPAAVQADRPAEEDGASEADVAADPAPLSYTQMEYQHYDPQEFYDEAETMAALADAGDAEGAFVIYSSLHDAIEYLDSMYSLAMIRYDADIYSSFWSGEYAYTESLWTELADLLAAKTAYVLDSPAGEAFAARIGSETAEEYADYEAMTDEQKAADERELEIVDEYYALYDTMDEITYSYKGEDWTLEMFYGMKGDRLYDRDYDAYVDVYYGLQQALCEAFSPLYIELVQLWTQQARDAGYDSYADYAYEELYGRQYTGEEAQAFCDAVKPIARAYFDELYYSPLYDEALEIRMETDAQSLFSLVEGRLSRIDPALEGPWQQLTERGLYDIRQAESGRYAGSWTTSLSWYDAPFIFMTEDGSCLDLITFTHEFGHFCDFCLNPIPDVMISVGDLDLQEIHSNGLQALFTLYYGEIFGKDADAAAFMNISDLIDNVVEGCIYDEFQRLVMEQPDTLTPEKLNDLYVSVCADYGFYGEDFLPSWDADWVYVSHQFDAPVYYISYAASAFAALQLWDMAQDDPDAACDAYMAVLTAGAYDDGYADVLHQAGLRAFSDEGAVQEVLGDVLEQLADFNA